MNRLSKWTWTAALIALMAVAVRAEKAITLKIGDAAPKLEVSKWVQGDPVKEFERNKAYIVEFWATWCGPCKVSIPHLNEIHNKFKDKSLVVIGQDVWEQDTSKVEPFVQNMGDKMSYRVALDLTVNGDKNTGKMAANWMSAAGQNGIPTAFVVNKEGVIAWIGHPMQLNDAIIEQILDGSFDIKKAAEQKEQEMKAQALQMKYSKQLSEAMQKKDWATAEATLNELEKSLPPNQRSGVDMVRFRILLSKEDSKGAIAFAGKISDAQPENAMLQNELAWQLATNEGFKDRDLDLAAKIATRANEAAKGKDSAILDTCARIAFMQGKKDKAVELQERALKIAGDGAKAALQKTLDSYKQGVLPKAN